MYSSSSAEETVDSEGNESISSASSELRGGSMKLSLLLIDMTGYELGKSGDWAKTGSVLLRQM